MPINGVPHPKGSQWGKKISSSGGSKGGCLPMIVVPAIGLITSVLAVIATGR